MHTFLFIIRYSKLNLNFRALIIVKHIKIMLDDRANIKWDPDEEEEEPELNVGCLS